MNKYDDYEEVTSVTMDNIESYTKKGYKLIEIYYTEYPYQNSYTAYNSNNCSYQKYTNPVVVKTTMALIGLKKDEVVQQEREKSAKAELETMKLRGDISKFEKEAKSHADAVAKLNVDLKRSLDATDMYSKQAIEERKKSGMMELDLIRLREAIGELKFNEILGAKK